MKIFESFECSGQILSNSYADFEIMSRYLSKFCIPLQFHEGLLLCTFFSSNNIYFAHKEPIKVKIFETLERSGQNLTNFLCQFLNDKSIPLQILHHSSLPQHITSLWILSSHFSYFGLKDPINMPILRLSIALVKICHIPHVIFQITSQFFFKFCITLQCHER